MNNSKMTLSVASIIVAAMTQVSGNASAHLEPETGDRPRFTPHRSPIWRVGAFCGSKVIDAAYPWCNFARWSR